LTKHGRDILFRIVLVAGAALILFVMTHKRHHAKNDTGRDPYQSSDDYFAKERE